MCVVKKPREVSFSKRGERLISNSAYRSLKLGSFFFFFFKKPFGLTALVTLIRVPLVEC